MKHVLSHPFLPDDGGKKGFYFPKPLAMGRLSLIIAVILVLSVSSCKDFGEAPSDTAKEVVTVAMKNTEMYQYRVVGVIFDEDGAVIFTQARHYQISEIRREASTNWQCVYVYQPAAGYVGSDKTEIEVRTGSDGASPPTSITRLAFQFTITN